MKPINIKIFQNKIYNYIYGLLTFFITLALFYFHLLNKISLEYETGFETHVNSFHIYIYYILNYPFSLFLYFFCDFLLKNNEYEMDIINGLSSVLIYSTFSFYSLKLKNKILFTMSILINILTIISLFFLIFSFNLPKQVLINNFESDKNIILSGVAKDKEYYNLIPHIYFFHFHNEPMGKKWQIILAENGNEYFEQEVGCSLLDYNMLFPKFYGLKMQMQLNDNQAEIRAIFWLKKAKTSNCLYLIKSNVLINNSIEDEALSGDPNLAKELSDKYKENDEKKYVKWLIIGAENGNKISQYELSQFLFKKLTIEELGLVNLYSNEKNLRAKFWLNKSKE